MSDGLEGVVAADTVLSEVDGQAGRLIIRPVNWLLGKFFGGFNAAFDAATRLYGRAVGRCLRLSALVLLVYLVTVVKLGPGVLHRPL